MCARVASVPVRLPAFNYNVLMSSAKNKMDEVFRPYLLCSENIGSEEKLLLEKSFRVLTLPPFDALDNAVASHADMLLCPIGEALAAHSDYYSENRAIFDENYIKIVTIAESASKKYPNDILLNGLFLSENLYGRIDKLSKTLVRSAKKAVFTRQGYTRCSVCKLSERAIITADPSIANAASENGVDVLQISSGNIVLDGYDYGFIGGASFTYNNTVFFFGRIESHPDFDKIRDFAAKHSVKLVSLSDKPLYDIGGAVIYER